MNELLSRGCVDKIYCTILQIEISPVDSVVHPSNNQGYHSSVGCGLNKFVKLTVVVSSNFIMPDVAG